MLGLIGCRSVQPSPTISIDGWWDVDYAKNACEMLKGESQQGFAVPCIDDPTNMAYEVEKDFLSAFQANPECAEVSIANDFHNPYKDAATTKSTNAQWSLSFNIGIKSGELSPADSEWQIIDTTTLHHYADGNLTDYFQAASKVCTVVKGAGGSVVH